MKQYLGTKLIFAVAMTRQAFCDYIDREIDQNTSGDEPGYLVEYTDGGKGNHPSHEGYISWSPAAVFERSYRPVDGLPFSLALEALKQGKSVTRCGLVIITMHEGSASDNARKATENGKDGMWLNRGREATHTANCFSIADRAGNTTYGWMPSLDDLLATNWGIVQ